MHFAASSGSMNLKRAKESLSNRRYYVKKSLSSVNISGDCFRARYVCSANKNDYSKFCLTNLFMRPQI